MTSTSVDGPARELQIPKNRADRGPAASAVIGETPRHFIARTGQHPYLRVVVVGGASFASLWKGEPAAVPGETRGRAWDLGGDVDADVDVFVITPLAPTTGPAAFARNTPRHPHGVSPLLQIALAISRASLLVLDGATEADARHALKLAAVAAVPAAAFVVDVDDTASAPGVDTLERDARALLLRYGVDGDNAFALRADASALASDAHGLVTTAKHGDVARIKAALTPVLARLHPRLLPDVPLVTQLELAQAEKQATAGQLLFTGRCVVGAAVAGSTVTLADACLPPPAKQIAWLDEVNEVVAVRKVRRP